jgi:alkanesulfonate monooxygenase SsuD/methylene tetrahydromethanopterin reductase-like flavin-dependent oxidoreductase (luciferase family)
MVKEVYFFTVFLGNVLPIHDNPLRVAEEIAMIDILSGGRVVCGFVCGIGQESLATNTNPVYNRERFDEAHDLILKAWTTPGPFRWEGTHYHYRVVNPWVRPLQQPHPPIWIPGVVSPESIRWAAAHRYPYVALAPALDLLEEIYGLYDEVAAAAGFTPTAEQRGYAIRVSVADSDAQAYEEGKHFFWQLGTSFGVAPRHWQAPPGYMSRVAAQGQRAQRRATAANVTPGGPSLSYEEAHATYQIVSGSPDTVIKKLKRILDLVDPAYLILWGREGPMSHKVAMRAIDLLAQEVIPALKDYQPDREKGRNSRVSSAAGI